MYLYIEREAMLITSTNKITGDWIIIVINIKY